MAGYSGLSPQMEGPTHHAITDIAVMRSLPRMTVVSPADAVALAKLLPHVAAWPGPVYFRFSRQEVPLVYDETCALEIGRAVTVREGSDVTFVAVGTMVARSLAAARELESHGIEAGVVDLHTIKPIDVDAILAAASRSRAIVTAEEHSIIGGLGGAVAEVIADLGIGVPVRRVGLRDEFAESGPYFAMLDKFGMSVDALVTTARAALDQATRRTATSNGGLFR